MLIAKKGEFPIGSLELKLKVDLSITPNYNNFYFILKQLDVIFKQDIS